MKLSGRALLMIILVFLSPLAAVDELETELFYEDLQHHIYLEYQRCTGDTTASIDSALQWKKNLSRWANSSVYDSVYAVFVEQTGLSQGVRPCEVLFWARAKHAQHLADSQRIRLEIEKRKKQKLDSIALAMDLSNWPSDAFDFLNVPLGVSRKSFLTLLDSSLSRTAIVGETVIYLPQIRIVDHSFVGVVHFNKYDRFYRYELQSPLYSADSLELHLRPFLWALEHFFIQSLGPEDRRRRIGFSDIFPDKLNVTAYWKQGDRRCHIGLGLAKNRYYAKCLVIDKELAQMAETAAQRPRVVQSSADSAPSAPE